jgi:transposase InsO family protein
VLTQRIISLACQYGRYGYRRITAMVNHSGLRVSRDRVARIWRREALQVPRKQRPQSRFESAAVDKCIK